VAGVLSGKSPEALRYDELVRYLREKKVKSAHWRQTELTGELTDGTEFQVTVPEKDSPSALPVIQLINESGFNFSFDGPPVTEMLISVLSVLAFPMMILTVIYFFLIKPTRSVARQPIASFSGDKPGQTEPFTIPPGRNAYIAWSTSSGRAGLHRHDGSFSASLKSFGDNAEVQLLANLVGEGSGTTSCHHEGMFYVDIVTERFWSVQVYLKP
jgi:hypothetical protein